MLDVETLRLEWERKIPEEAMAALKELMAGDNFDEMMPEVINRINQLSYKTFGDLPRGGQADGAQHIINFPQETKSASP